MFRLDRVDLSGLKMVMKDEGSRSGETGKMTRRSFLGRAATAAGMALGGNLLAQKVPASGMTLGFTTYGTKSMMTEDALKMLGLIGFDSVELATRTGWDCDPDGMSSGRLTDLTTIMKRWNLRVRALMENVRPEADLTMHRMTLDRLRRVGEFAHKLSPEAPPIIESTLGGGDWDSVKGLYLDRLGDWQTVASDTQTVIVIKPHRFGAMSKPSHAIELIDRLGNSPWLRMAYDFSHYSHRDMTMEETLAEALPYTAFVAVKDTVMVDDKARFVLPGEAGDFDYPEFFRLLEQGGYTGDVNCEVSGMVSNQPTYDPRVAAETCYANMASAMLTAGIQRV